MTGTVRWLWQRGRVREEAERSYRDAHADKVIERVDELVSDLEEIVEELHDISGRFPRVGES